MKRFTVVCWQYSSLVTYYLLEVAHEVRAARRQGEGIEAAQAKLDAVDDISLLVEGCYFAAHHFIAAGVEWRGISHPQSHPHGQNIALLKQAGAPQGVLDAWNMLEWAVLAMCTAARQMAQQPPKLVHLWAASRLGLCRHIHSHPLGAWSLSRRARMAKLSDANTSLPGRDATVPVHPTSRLLRLYAHEYPILVDALTRLVDEVRFHHRNITLLALFGSVARLEPGVNSDTDLLALFDVESAPDVRQREDELALELFHTIYETVYAEAYPWPRWGITTVTGDALGHNLDPNLLSVIGKEGVLLFRRSDAQLPTLLGDLKPFDEWREHVQAVIAERD